MQRSSRDSILLDLSKISNHEHSYGAEQLILHLTTQMRSSNKFVSFAATRAMYSVLVSTKELAVHSLALTGLFSDIQAGTFLINLAQYTHCITHYLQSSMVCCLAFMEPSLHVEFSLELMSKLLKRFQHDHVVLSAGMCQLYFECLQKLWPLLLELQMGAHHVTMVPFLSLTCDILKFKFESCTYADGSHYSIEESTVLSCQTTVVDICSQKILPLLSYCRNLYEMKKCIGLFNRLCTSLHNRHSSCSTILDSIVSSSLVKCILINWLLLPSQSTDILYIRELFNVNTTVTSSEEVADKSLLVTVVRKLTVLVIKCLGVMADKGKGVDWLGQFACKISVAADNHIECEKSLRNIMLEILLDQDDAMMDAFCYCLKITKSINVKDVTSGSVIIYNVLNINYLFIKFLCAISYDHVVLMDYVISDETCFVQFLICYLEYAYDNWSSFTSSHYDEDVTRTASYFTDEPISSSCRKRKHSERTTEHAVQVDDQPLVTYDLSDSSEEGNTIGQSVFHKTMSCIIRLQLALERMLEKQIILNSQSSAQLVSVIERLETLYERMD